MADGRIQQVQIVLHTQLFEFCTCGGVKLCALSTETHVDPIYVVHQFQSGVLTDVLKEGAAKIVGDIVLAVRKSACAAKAVHDRAALAADATFDFFTIDGTVTLMECMASLKHSDL